MSAGERSNSTRWVGVGDLVEGGEVGDVGSGEAGGVKAGDVGGSVMGDAVWVEMLVVVY